MWLNDENKSLTIMSWIVCVSPKLSFKIGDISVPQHSAGGGASIIDENFKGFPFGLLHEIFKAIKIRIKI